MVSFRRTAFLAALLALCCSVSLAQERYGTLSQIRQQAADGWHEVYTDQYGRETTVDIDVEVYGGETAPVVKVRPLKLEIDGALLEDGSVFMHRTICRNNPADDIFGARSGQVTMTVHHTYGEKIDMDRVYGAEFGAQLTMSRLEARARELLEPMGISLDSILFEQPKEFSVRCKMEKNTQKVIAPAAYLAHFWQTLHGMPIFESIGRGYERGAWPEFAPQVQITMRGEDEYSITLWNVEETEILSPDIPLASFETVKRSIEAKIKSGHIQRVYSMRLGYVVYNEKGYPGRRPEHIRTWEDIDSYYLVPTWMIECVYMDNPKKTFVYGGRSGDEWMDNEKNSGHYHFVMVNAQTGEAYDREDRSMKGYGDTAYRGFIPWDDVK